MTACNPVGAALFLLLTLMMSRPAIAQHPGVFLCPGVGIGLTRNYNSNGISLGEIPPPGSCSRAGLDAGYMFSHQYGLVTGIGYSDYHYRARMVYKNRVNGNNNSYDTTVAERQQYLSVPLALKIYLGKEVKNPVLTGYLEAGCRVDFLLSATYQAGLGSSTGQWSGKNRGDFFPVLLKGYFKLGADIPLEGRSTLLLAFMTGRNLTENLRQDARIISNYELSLPIYALDLGVRVQL